MEENLWKILNNFYENNILYYIESFKQQPVKFISVILDLAIVMFLFYSLIKITKNSSKSLDKVC